MNKDKLYACCSSNRLILTIRYHRAETSWWNLSQLNHFDLEPSIRDSISFMFHILFLLLVKEAVITAFVRQPKDRTWDKDREKSNNEKKREWNEWVNGTCRVCSSSADGHRTHTIIVNRLSYMWRHPERTTSRDGLGSERVRPQTNVLLAVWAAPFRYIYTFLLCYFGGLYYKQTNNPRWLDITRKIGDFRSWVD